MIDGPAPTTVPLPQATLEWPGTDETCPKCHGQRHVYYLHPGQPGVEVIGGSIRERSCTSQSAITTQSAFCHSGMIAGAWRNAAAVCGSPGESQRIADA